MDTYSVTGLGVDPTNILKNLTNFPPTPNPQTTWDTKPTQ